MKSLLLLALFMLVYASATAQSNSPCNQGRAEFPRVDPRNEDAICLPQIGVIGGTIPQCKYPQSTEDFGSTVYAIDSLVDGLSALVVAHQRCDTAGPGGRFPKEVLLYRGVQNGLPGSSSGERIGPTEINSITTFLAAGDWDADGHRDLACRVEIMGDTSFANVDRYYISHLVVFWGSDSGRYDIHDTTRLSSGTDAWLGIYPSVGKDLDGDGVDDLLARTSGGFLHGVPVPTPRVHLFHGHRRERWGQNAIPHTADWTWWGSGVVLGDPVATDQDGDGAVDVAFHHNDNSVTGDVTVLYGKKGSGLPDTTEAESVSLAISNGKYSVFEDVTGDHIPELVQTSGSEDKIKIFIGLKGQRLKEQYGSGHDAPQPGQPKWWGKPWAELWMPRKINGNWFGDYNQLYDLGDGNLDGISDIWAFSWPYLLMYSTGTATDSLVDALSDMRPGDYILGAAVLKNFDGSAIPTIAYGTGNSVHFLKPSKEVPHFDVPRLLPPGTGSAGIGDWRSGNDGTKLQLRAIPNPGQGQIHLRWKSPLSPGMAMISIMSTVGARVAEYQLTANKESFVWSTSGIAAGTYFITLIIDSRHATTQVVVQD
jgi:hypothetical protein